jgi:hypothetical protein
VKDEWAFARVAQVDGDNSPEKEVVIPAGVDGLELALYRRQGASRERSARRAISAAQRVEGREAAGALGGGEEPAQALLVGGE